MGEFWKLHALWRSTCLVSSERVWEGRPGAALPESGHLTGLEQRVLIWGHVPPPPASYGAMSGDPM